MRVFTTIRGFLELSRLSNAPTCLTNVLVGCSAASVVLGADLPLDSYLLISGAVLLLYVAGMALNDVVDVEFDRVHRPGRPIPSGRVMRSQAIALVIVALFAAWACIIIVLLLALPEPLAPHVLPVALSLTGCIVLYDFIHKKIASSVILMGACRGLIYILAAVLIKWPSDSNLILICALTTTLYIIVLTIIARGEHRSGERKPGAELLLPLIILLPMPFARPDWWGWPIFTALLAIAWIVRSSMHLRGRSPSPPRAVMGWLAGICLIDAYYLTLLPNAAPLALIALACFVMTVLAQQRILGS